MCLFVFQLDRELTTRREKEKGATGSEKRLLPPQPKKSKVDQANLDADDPLDASDQDSDTDSSDDEDDTAALMAELQRIKKERAADSAKKEAEKRAEEERIRAENILSGNPLLNYTGNIQAPKADMKVLTYYQ
jgi:protein CWC15